MSENRGNHGNRRGGRPFRGSNRGRGQESGQSSQSFQRSDTERTDYRGGGGGRNQGRGSSEQGRGRGQSWGPREGQEQDRGSSGQGRGRGQSWRPREGQEQDRESSGQGRGRGQSWRPREGQEQDRDRSFNQEYERRDQSVASERSDQSRGSSSNYFRASGRGRPYMRAFGGRPPSEDVTSQERQSEWVPPPSQHSWASVAQPSTSAQVVENLATMTLETSPRGSSEHPEQPPETTEAGPKKNKRSKGKRKEMSADPAPGPVVAETSQASTKTADKTPTSGSAEGSKEKPGKAKPSTSTSTAPVPSSSGTSSAKIPEKTTISGSGERPPSAITTIPRRVKQGPISAGSEYFDQRCNKWVIEVNYLPITFSNKNMKILHYDVQFPDKIAKSNFRPLINKMRRIHFPNRHPAFDGVRNLYAAVNPLFKGNSVTSTISHVGDNGVEKEYEITIQLANHDVELTISTLYKYIQNGCSLNIPSATIQAIDVAIRGYLPDRFTGCGRAFYTQPREKRELSAGLQLFNGFTQSAILGYKPYLNVDVSHRGFYTDQSLLDYLEALMVSKAGYNREPDFREFDQGLRRDTLEALETYVKQNNGLRFTYKDPATNAIRHYRLGGLGGKPKDTIFEITQEGKARPISVYDYYRSGKGYTIRYPNLPVVKTNRAREEFFPLECCSIVGNQPVQNKYKYSPDETRNMIRHCTDVPKDRKDKILTNIREAKYNQDDIHKEFGITIGDGRGFLQVQAANLLSPNVIYRNGPARVNNGVWEMKEFYNGAQIFTWIILNANDRTGQRELDNLKSNLMSNGRDVGVHLDEPVARPLGLRNFSERDITDAFQNLKERYKKLDLVVVILPGGSMAEVVYRRVKYVSEIKVGVLTQCIQARTVQRIDRMTAKNILLKINSKVTGVNHIMNHPNKNQLIFDGSTMFLGADVTHPPPGPKQKEEPSISAVAGSYDPYGFKYKMLYRVQSSRQEMIDGMERMVFELLQFFKDQNAGKLPNKIYYYRDGVSEGQFSQVLDVELRAIRAACQRLGGGIKVTVIIVQKRHHTRFFPPREIGDRKGNVQAGTVVNSEITHPVEHDFFLVSHQSIQGTARPTKYHVLYDEIQATEDYVEALTYYLCFMFARCTRSVSYPAPTYYSHLAADRAGKYVKCARESANCDLTIGPIGNGVIHGDMAKKNPMYFV